MRAEKRQKDPMSYRDRTYRGVAESSGLVSTYIRIRETDLHILAESDVTEKAGALMLQFRLQVEHYIASHPGFATALTPIPADDLAPPIIRDMLFAGLHASVGPMAAVAGAIAEYVGRGLMADGHKEIIVENGGDIFLQRSKQCTVAIFAGQSPLSNRVGLTLDPAKMPVGICTSSGRIGHSLSLGQADSVTVVAESTAFADAAATRLGNEVGHYQSARDGIDRALKKAQELSAISGVLVICGEVMGASGDITLIPLE